MIFRLKHEDFYGTWRQANKKYNLLTVDEMRDFLKTIEYDFNKEADEGVFKYKDGHEPLRLPTPLVAGRDINIPGYDLGMYWLKDKYDKHTAYCFGFTNTGYAIMLMPDNGFYGVLSKK